MDNSLPLPPPETVSLDASQFQRLIDAVSDNGFLEPSNIVSGAALLAALFAIAMTWLIYHQQKTFEKRRLTAQLHDQWWSSEIDEKRHIVWAELEKWEKEKEDAPSIKSFSHKGDKWEIQSKERRAHARVLYFFCDIHTMIESDLLDRDMAFELFGVHHYQWFRQYFGAIRRAVLERPQGADEQIPRYVHELQQFEENFDAWAKSRKRPLRSELSQKHNLDSI